MTYVQTINALSIDRLRMRIVDLTSNKHQRDEISILYNLYILILDDAMQQFYLVFQIEKCSSNVQLQPAFKF